MRLTVLFVVALCVVVLPATAGGQAASTLLNRHDLDRRTAWFELPGRLDEISGLAFTPDGRLFGHDDERATVHEINTQTGEVGKRFSLGDPPVRADFEALAIVGERFFLVTSRGILYEFREVGDREETPYRITDTELRPRCEPEGLDHDPVDDALLIACKDSALDREAIVVHRVPLDSERDRLAPIVIARSQLRAHDVEEDFAASAIAVDPTGTLILVSGRTESLIEVDRTGRVLAGTQLRRRRHRQSEGLAFGPDGTLYIADEKNENDAARITAYARVRDGDGDR